MLKCISKYLRCKDNIKKFMVHLEKKFLGQQDGSIGISSTTCSLSKTPII